MWYTIKSLNNRWVDHSCYTIHGSPKRGYNHKEAILVEDVYQHMLRLSKLSRPVIGVILSDKDN